MAAGSVKWGLAMMLSMLIFYDEPRGGGTGIGKHLRAEHISTNPDNWTYNWGSESLYANTITVGMWNTDPQDHWHATSPHLMPEIDIYADGVKNTFDWSLGTSYATPAVAAEVVNFLSYVTGDAEFTSIDEYYDALFNHLSEADPSFSNVSGSIDIDGADYTAFIDTIIAEITTEVEITFDDGSTKTVNVLETDADCICCSA